MLNTYSYDWLGRVATETVDGVTTTFAYDAVGNLISKTTGDVTTNYVLNELDQVTSVTQGSVTLATYTYDLSGNRATKYSYGTTTTYTYDGQNNMVSASNGNFTYDYTYDANGELLTKTKGNDVYKYYFDGVNLLFTKKNDSYNNRYLYADGAVYAAVGGAENFYWYSTDVRGSSSSILKSDSTANHGVKRIRDFSYDPYGDTTNAGHVYAEPEMDEIAYTGGVFDKELGLYYLMSRYYDPMIAQFISEDSYRGDGEHFWNLYMYCDGDPVNKTDRNGKYGLWKADSTKLKNKGTTGTGAAMNFSYCKKNYPNANCLGFALGINSNINPYTSDVKNTYSIDDWFKGLKTRAKNAKRWIRKLSGQYAKIFPNEYRCAMRCLTSPAKVRIAVSGDKPYDCHYMRQLHNGFWGDKHGTGAFYHSNHSNPDQKYSWRDYFQPENQVPLNEKKFYTSKTIYFAVSKYKYK